MARNAIESDFRSSKMAAKGHFVKNSKQITLLATFHNFSHFSLLFTTFHYFSSLFITFPHFSPLFPTFHHFSPLFPTFPTFHYFFPLFPTFFPLFTTFSHFWPLSEFFPTFSHFFLFLATFHYFWPLFTSFSPLFPTFHYFSPLFFQLLATFPNFFPLFPTFPHFSPHAFSAPWVYTLHIITRWMWCGECAIKPTPTPGLMAWWRRIHDNATSIQIHNYNVNNHGAIWSILGTVWVTWIIAPSLLDWIVAAWTAIVLLIRNLVIPVWTTMALSWGNAIYCAMKTPCKFVAMWKGYKSYSIYATAACKPFGDIHSICPQANTPILVYQ